MQRNPIDQFLKDPDNKAKLFIWLTRSMIIVTFMITIGTITLFYTYWDLLASLFTVWLDNSTFSYNLSKPLSLSMIVSNGSSFCVIESQMKAYHKCC